ncbi:LysR family transcriptional regulator [Burkholderia territorii]|uniref:LysR family transcriptional regulator n=1 Tax=Burkholderia territorii TaxID=1503055 RepID=A0A6L3NN59_9BURK|nr:LysR family transcriptional regulator [Burkholderia territorii]KAB0685222.1 LysR family transcriptional regulator [Burkholderia territorii]KVL45449.1 LysR family transcriptional regulator [Burkholderia territorii]KVN40371.1 LysR family transcriptional regulator [Burkholderia territorii]MBM2773584.1 LysR family transcriptional regulator [Burkholderia territorii]VWB67333.1 LysR family transcriptional regulator [Burkholderia territorii]
MLDAVTLDQIRTFIAAAETGSFSAAGRRLGRAQSVVSQTLANLEGQLGVQLFDRTSRSPTLTVIGRELLVDARVVAGDMDRLKARAKGLAGGLEPELSVVVHVFLPTGVLTQAVSAFHQQFPRTPLRISVEGMGAVIEPVLEGLSSFGVRAPLLTNHPDLTSEHLMTVPYLMVAAPQHPLAHYGRPIPARELAQHVQLVLSDRSRLTGKTDLGVLSPETWRLSDLGAKHAFLKAGLGWGGMPYHAVEADIADGSLVPLEFEETRANAAISLSAIYRTDTPPGPAGRWLLDQLKAVASRANGVQAS